MWRGVVWIGILWVYAQEPANRPVSYTLADRDRLIKVEAEVSAIKEQIADVKAQIAAMNARIDRLETRIDRLEDRIDLHFSILAGMIGLQMTLTAGLIGFILWDRRKAAEPIERRLSDLEGEVRRLVASPGS